MIDHFNNLEQCLFICMQEHLDVMNEINSHHDMFTPGNLHAPYVAFCSRPKHQKNRIALRRIDWFGSHHGDVYCWRVGCFEESVRDWECHKCTREPALFPFPTTGTNTIASKFLREGLSLIPRQRGVPEDLCSTAGRDKPMGDQDREWSKHRGRRRQWHQLDSNDSWG